MLSQRRYERHLVIQFRRSLSEVLQLREALSWRVLAEPSIGRVRPDLLLGGFDPRSFAGYRPATTALEAFALAVLSRSGPLTDVELAVQLNARPHRVERWLRKLQRVGMIRRRRDMSWALVPRFSSARVDIIAIEAKLTRWRDAINQARTYLDFADTTYVVLDQSSATSLDRAAVSCAEDGVGLLIRRGSSFELIVRARRMRPRSALRETAVDRLFSGRADARPV